MNTEQLTEQWRTLVPLLKSTIQADREFYTAAVDKFSIVVVSDETNKHEAPYQTVIEYGFAVAEIRTRYDLIGFFLHIASHHKCDQLWEKCPTLMSTFTPDQLDFIEEVYNQRLVSVVAPNYYDLFPETTHRYDLYKQFNVDNRRQLQTMLTQRVATGDTLLDELHQWLYSSDPLLQQTFNGYIRLWSLLVTEPTVSELIDQYES